LVAIPRHNLVAAALEYSLLDGSPIFAADLRRKNKKGPDPETQPPLRERSSMSRFLRSEIHITSRVPRLRRQK
jgi:hypothetical protein